MPVTVASAPPACTCSCVFSDSGATNGASTAAPARTRAADLGLAIEQSGRVVPLDTEGSAVLERTPFIVVLTFASPGGVMLNASTSRRWFDVVAVGDGARELDSVVGPGRELAQHEPPAAELLVTDHAGYLMSDDRRRASGCNAVSRDGDRIVCRRAVRALATDDPGPYTPIEIARWPGRELYLVATTRAIEPSDLRAPALARARLVFR